MRRFFLSPQELAASPVVLSGDEFHHLKNVTRLEEGERVELLDGEGTLALAEIKKIGKKEAELEVIELKKLTPPPRPHIQLALCLPKFQTMDLVIQKMAELGVREITPILSERSFLKKSSPVLLEKIPRWEKISREACKQSGRAWPMTVSEPRALSDFLKKIDPENSLFLYEGEARQDIKAAFGKFPKTDKSSELPSQVTVFVGPEGGFSPNETSVFQTKGLHPVTMGDLVLRVETACIAIVSVIKYHFDLMR